MAYPHPPMHRQRRQSHGYYDSQPPAYKPDAYATYTPVVLPWNPYHHQSPQPAVQPQPEGYGYFSWPSTSTVDSLSEMDNPKSGGNKHKKGLFSSFRRKSQAPEGHLHRYLLNSRPVSLVYDMRNAPATACIATNPPAPLSAVERAQLATAPARTQMRITCDLIPWTITIQNPNGVTVGDVLEGLFASMQRRVRRSEWLIAPESQQEKVVRAFAWRCYSSRSPPGYEEQQGPKRVDWLVKRTIFRGLSHGSEEDMWVLHISTH